MYSREIPFFRILLPYLLGILLNQWYPFPKEYFDKSTFFLALLLIGILINLSYNYKTKILLPGVMLVILFVLGWKSPNQSEGQLLEEGKVEELIMEIESVSKSKFYTNYTVQTKLLKIDNEWRTHRQKILIKSKLDLNYPKGEIVCGKFYIKNPKAPASKNEFNYKRYLKNKNINQIGYVVKTNFYTVGREESLLTKIEDLRIYLLKILENNFADLQTLSIAKSIILGEKSDLSDETKITFKNTGTMHILAVSGLHVGICFLLVFYLIKPLKNNNLYRKIALLSIQIAVIFFYVLITGSNPSAIRASTMFALYLISKEFNLSNNNINTLLSTAFLMLVIDPKSIYDPGFQFSFLALGGIFLLYKKIKNLWIPSTRWINHFWEITAVGISAQIPLIPIIIFYSGEMPVYFLLSGILVMDLTFAILILGIISLILFPFCTHLRKNGIDNFGAAN
ncbi:MAG: ComEC/Rec2 family competence protein [Saprospiraceae bacterium]